MKDCLLSANMTHPCSVFLNLCVVFDTFTILFGRQAQQAERIGITHAELCCINRPNSLLKISVISNYSIGHTKCLCGVILISLPYFQTAFHLSNWITLDISTFMWMIQILLGNDQTQMTVATAVSKTSITTADQCQEKIFRSS